MGSWTRLSNGPNPTPSHLRMPTHTPPAPEPGGAARLTSPPTERSPFPPTPISPRTTQPSSRPLSINSQSLLPLRPTRAPSRCTPVVLSPEPTAEPTSTTVSLPLDTALNTSSSRTPGVHPGVMLDTSNLALNPTTLLVSAVSSPDPHPTQPPTEHSVPHCMLDELICSMWIEFSFLNLKSK